MEERRSEPREQLVFYHKVILADRGTTLGGLVELSTEGIRVQGEIPVQVGTRLELGIVEDDGPPIRFSAVCAWCRPWGAPGHVQIGFEVEHVLAESLRYMHDLIARHAIRNV